MTEIHTCSVVQPEADSHAEKFTRLEIHTPGFTRDCSPGAVPEARP